MFLLEVPLRRMRASHAREAHAHRKNCLYSAATAMQCWFWSIWIVCRASLTAIVDRQSMRTKAIATTSEILLHE
ncbi:hypothetical protein Y032_0017g3451 [Ancylostoma ceylanicum]|uniref:Uncharacterized protein n=1 Tax=Ancylostoma ceylanicum TaxID=53326 RepID=A0A016V7B9_9BILA|nr:hypothetical protein Y032_0017g3451 [Ancylostoma ceylanicum]